MLKSQTQNHSRSDSLYKISRKGNQTDQKQISVCLGLRGNGSGGGEPTAKGQEKTLSGAGGIDVLKPDHSDGGTILKC